jgi:hypothetical protein
MQAAKHVLCYIKGTLDYSICYSATSESQSHSPSLPLYFSDPSRAADFEDRKSHSGLFLPCRRADLVISASSRCPTILSVSRIGNSLATRSFSDLEFLSGWDIKGVQYPIYTWSTHYFRILRHKISIVCRQNADQMIYIPSTTHRASHLLKYKVDRHKSIG